MSHTNNFQHLEGLNASQLKRLLIEQLTRQKLGLYWESNAIERDRALNENIVLPRFVPEWSHGLEGDALVEGTGNLIIEGDNFDSLRLLRSTHTGRIRVIYIDPPYNTGNKDWVYNDRYVGANDRWRHSQWLEFLYRRLQLAKDLLTQDGVIIVSINDENRARLELLMDDVFPGRRLGSLVWRTKDTSNDLSRRFSHVHEHVLVYANPGFTFNGRPTDRSKYRNPDNDSRGDWSPQPLTKAHTYTDRENTYYPIQDPNTGYWYPCDPNRVWAYASEQEIRKRFDDDEDAVRAALGALRSDTMEALIAKEMIYFPPCAEAEVMRFESRDALIEAVKKGKGPQLPKKKTPLLREDLPDLDFWIGKPIAPGRPSRKEHWTARPASERLAPLSSWIAGLNEDVQSLVDEGEEEPVVLRSARGGVATEEVKTILGSKAFPYPKPIALIYGLLSQSSRPGDIVLDFFAGSATTGHCVLKLNAEQPNELPRHFILCSSTEANDKEPNKNLCRDVCAERMRRVIAAEPALANNRFGYLQLDKFAPNDSLFESDAAHAFQLLSLRLAKVVRPLPNDSLAAAGVQLLAQNVGDGGWSVLLHRPTTRALAVLERLPLSSSPRHGNLKVYSSRPAAVRMYLEQAWLGSGRTVESLSLAHALRQGQIAPRRKRGVNAVSNALRAFGMDQKDGAV
jgi:adenine-specific DNA-methyltransferase